MEVEMHMHQGVQIGELRTVARPLRSTEDVLELLGNFYGGHVQGIILPEACLAPEFFELRSRLAGELLQKFVNYQVKVAIVGDFQKYTSKALADFIYECNRGSQIFFVATREEALGMLAQAAKHETK